jgi:hypothetical protein
MQMGVTSCKKDPSDLPGWEGGEGGLAGSAGSSSMAGGGSGGRPKGPELCGIAIQSECENNMVEVSFGRLCNEATIECPAGCVDDLDSISGSPFRDYSLAEVEEAVCNPLNQGGAAGSSTR